MKIILSDIQWGGYWLDVAGKVMIPLAIGWVSYIVAKRQITNAGVTQFRQRWIDNLRDAVSLFISKAEVISLLDLDDDDRYYEHFKELSQMQHKVELFLNPSESDHNEIVQLLEEIRDLVHDEEMNDRTEQRLSDKIDDLMKVTKRVLKREWNVVKKGK